MGGDEGGSATSDKVSTDKIDNLDNQKVLFFLKYFRKGYWSSKCSFNLDLRIEKWTQTCPGNSALDIVRVP